MAVTLIKGADLNAAIKELGKNAKDLTKHIHVLAVSACVEVVNTKNTSVLNRLTKAVENVGSKAILSWLKDNAPASFDLKAKKWVLMPNKRDKIEEEGVDAYAEAIAKKPYYTVRPDNAKTFAGFDTVKLLRSIIAREKKLTDEQRKDERSFVVGLDKIEALADELELMAEEGVTTTEGPAPIEREVPPATRRRRNTAQSNASEAMTEATAH